MPADIDVTVPIRIHERAVPTEWVDYNGHTNDSRYMQITSEAGDRFMRLIGVDEAYLQSGRSYYTVESHLNFIAQSHAGDHLYVTVQLLSHDAKRLHIFTTVHRADDDSVVATAEHMMLHVDAAGRQVVTGAGGGPGETRRDRSPSRPSCPSPLRSLFFFWLFFGAGQEHRSGATADRCERDCGRRDWAAQRVAAAATKADDTSALPRQRSARSVSHVVGVTPRSRRSDFSTFSVGVRGNVSTTST